MRESHYHLIPSENCRQPPTNRKRPREESYCPSPNILARSEISETLSIFKISQLLKDFRRLPLPPQVLEAKLNELFLSIQQKSSSENFAAEFDSWCKNQEDSNKISYLLFNTAVLTEKIETTHKLPGVFVTLILGELANHPNLKSKSIGIAILNAGKLAKHRSLNSTVQVQAINTLLTVLHQCRDYNSQTIANAILGAGYLANHHCLDLSGNKVPAPTINTLLTLLVELYQRRLCTSQDIATAILGAGYLANHHYLDVSRYPLSTETISTLLTLLMELYQRRLCTSQDIANTILGTAYLAKNHCLDVSFDKVPASTINTLLTLLVELYQRRLCTSQDIATAILGAGYLANHQCLDVRHNKISALTINNLLVGLCQPKFCKSSQEIAIAILGAGYLVKHQCLDVRHNKISALTINNLLVRLCQPDFCKLSKHIANAILGAGYLANHQGIDLSLNKIPALTLNTLLVKLPDCGDCDSQPIANAILGAGYLAKHQGLALSDYKVPALTIDTLLVKLPDCGGCDSMAIANAILGAGYLTNHQGIDLSLNKIPALTLNTLLLKLFQPNFCKSPQEIANAILGAGYLANHQALDLADNKIPALTINTLLLNLSQPDFCTSPQHISTAILGAGYLAKHQYLDFSDNKTPALTIDRLLVKLHNCRDCNSQAIANAILGAGYLANHDCLEVRQYKVSALSINNLLTNLYQPRFCPSEQSISNTILGIGYLANHDCLEVRQYKVSALSINTLLTKLYESSPRHIANAILGIGYLANHDCLDVSFLRIPALTIHTLLLRLHNCRDCDSQAIANALYALGMLITHQALDSTSLETFKQNASSLIEKSSTIPIRNKYLFAVQVLFCLRTLQHDRLAPDLLGNLIQKAVISPILNPVEAIRALALLSIYPSETLALPAIQSLFNWLIDSLSRLPKKPGTFLYQRFSILLQDTLYQIENNLINKNNCQDRFKNCFFIAPQEQYMVSNPTAAFPENMWSEEAAAAETETESETEIESDIDFVGASSVFPQHSSNFFGRINNVSSHSAHSSSSMPTPVSLNIHRPCAFPQQEHHTQQQIFDFIERGQLDNLKALLNYQPPRNLNPSGSIKSHNPRINLPVGNGIIIPTLPQNVLTLSDNAVKTFFEQVPDEAFSQLLSRDNIHSYLWVLVHSCTGKTFYGIARTPAFRRFYHMPVTELKKITPNLMHPRMLHQDHQALLNAIDSISLHPHYFVNDTLYNIQLDLLQEAIAYHTLCKHHKVLPLLNKRLSSLNNNRDIIYEPQDEAAAISLPVDEAEDIWEEDLTDYTITSSSQRIRDLPSIFNPSSSHNRNSSNSTIRFASEDEILDLSASSRLPAGFS